MLRCGVWFDCWKDRFVPSCRWREIDGDHCFSRVVYFFIYLFIPVSKKILQHCWFHFKYQSGVEKWIFIKKPDLYWETVRRFSFVSLCFVFVRKKKNLGCSLLQEKNSLALKFPKTYKKWHNTQEDKLMNRSYLAVLQTRIQQREENITMWKEKKKLCSLGLLWKKKNAGVHTHFIMVLKCDTQRSAVTDNVYTPTIIIIIRFLPLNLIIRELLFILFPARIT